MRERERKGERTSTRSERAPRPRAATTADRATDQRATRERERSKWASVKLFEGFYEWSSHNEWSWCIYLCMSLYIYIYQCIYKSICIYLHVRACVFVCIYSVWLVCLYARMCSRGSFVWSDTSHIFRRSVRSFGVWRFVGSGTFGCVASASKLIRQNKCVVLWCWDANRNLWLLLLKTICDFFALHLNAPPRLKVSVPIDRLV